MSRKFLISYKDVAEYTKKNGYGFFELTLKDFQKINKQRRTHDAIREAAREMGEFLVTKNKSYGNSALEPLRLFSTSDRKEQLRVRFDDKLNRLIQGHEVAGEDTMRIVTGKQEIPPSPWQPP